MCLASRLLENPKWLLENPKGPLAPGGPVGRLAPGGPATRFTKSINNYQKHARTHQEPPEPIQEAPEMLQELAEQLSISFHNKIKHQPQGHARARGGLFELQSPSDRITHAGAIEISRSDSPPNLRYWSVYIGGRGCLGGGQGRATSLWSEQRFQSLSSCPTSWSEVGG